MACQNVSPPGCGPLGLCPFLLLIGQLIRTHLGYLFLTHTQMVLQSACEGTECQDLIPCGHIPTSVCKRPQAYLWNDCNKHVLLQAPGSDTNLNGCNARKRNSSWRAAAQAQVDIARHLTGEIYPFNLTKPSLVLSAELLLQRAHAGLKPGSNHGLHPWEQT